ncbi:hypothetical protein GIB67_040600 [Kingdonia uniflora]|uniref:Uncharacterized protein n=1 Tax=Kingdonia uniflora TaxID=39325 RepID=A0A7J7M8V9_9MAGN|nr:hypothetical protein GIB67_040600 [Kingdonia uniflora]
MFGVYVAIKQYLAGDQDTSKLIRGSLVVTGGSIDAFKKILASEGVKGLYKGFEPTMAKSIAANAACFLAYEMTRSSNLEGKQPNLGGDEQEPVEQEEEDEDEKEVDG